MASQAFQAGISSICGVKTLILFSNSFWWFNRIEDKSNLQIFPFDLPLFFFFFLKF